MIHLLQSFAGGLCFAFGAFVGIGVAGLLVGRRDKARDAFYQNEFMNLNKKIEQRLGKQVEALEVIAKAASAKNTNETKTE